MRLPPADQPARATRVGSMGKVGSERMEMVRASMSWMAVGKGEAGALE